MLRASFHEHELPRNPLEECENMFSRVQRFTQFESSVQQAMQREGVVHDASTNRPGALQLGFALHNVFRLFNLTDS